MIGSELNLLCTKKRVKTPETQEEKSVVGDVFSRLLSLLKGRLSLGLDLHRRLDAATERKTASDGVCLMTGGRSVIVDQIRWLSSRGGGADPECYLTVDARVLLLYLAPTWGTVHGLVSSFIAAFINTLLVKMINRFRLN